MKSTKPVFIVLGLALAMSVAGCGPSAEELAARERERLRLEEQAQRDAKKANEAITEMNKKLGRKPPELDLDVTPAAKTEPAPAAEKKP